MVLSPWLTQEVLLEDADSTYGAVNFEALSRCRLVLTLDFLESFIVGDGWLSLDVGLLSSACSLS